MSQAKRGPCPACRREMAIRGEGGKTTLRAHKCEHGKPCIGGDRRCRTGWNPGGAAQEVRCPKCALARRKDVLREHVAAWRGELDETAELEIKSGPAPRDRTFTVDEFIEGLREDAARKKTKKAHSSKCRCWGCLAFRRNGGRRPFPF